MTRQETVIHVGEMRDVIPFQRNFKKNPITVQESEVHLITGGTASGKTMTALEVALLALSEGKSVFYYNNEETYRGVYSRLKHIANQLEVDVRFIDKLQILEDAQVLKSTLSNIEFYYSGALAETLTPLNSVLIIDTHPGGYSESELNRFKEVAENTSLTIVLTSQNNLNFVTPTTDKNGIKLHHLQGKYK